MIPSALVEVPPQRVRIKQGSMLASAAYRFDRVVSGSSLEYGTGDPRAILAVFSHRSVTGLREADPGHNVAQGSISALRPP